MMGGIVLVVKSHFGTRLWGGHAQDVSEWFKFKYISAISPPTQGDRHNGTITFDVEEKKIIIDSDYFTPSKEVIRFWRCLGFDILERSKSEPTHCSKCGAKLEPPRISPGPSGSGRVMMGGYYTTPESKDPLCPKCAQGLKVEGP